MSRIISEIFDGNYCPSAEKPSGYEYESTIHQIIELEKELRIGLKPEEWQKIQELLSLKNTALSITAEFMFAEGFKAGIRLIVEALGDDSSSIPE